MVIFKYTIKASFCTQKPEAVENTDTLLRSQSGHT